MFQRKGFDRTFSVAERTRLDSEASSDSNVSSKSEKIKNRKPTGRKVKKRKSAEELKMINQNYSNQLVPNICYQPGDYENVTTGLGIEIQEKTTKVKFHSLSPASVSQSPIVLETNEIEIVSGSPASDDEKCDKKVPTTGQSDIDQADKGDNSKVSDAANRKVITKNDSVNTQQGKTNPVSPSQTSSKIPKYINNKLKISFRTVQKKAN